MRHGWWLLGCLAACGDGGSAFPAPDPPDNCSAGRLSYFDNISIGKRDAGGGDHGFDTFTFVPGDHPTFDITDGAEHVHVEGETPLVPGDSVASRGFVKLSNPLGDNDEVPYDFGNCETGPFSGTLTLSADGTTFQFTIDDLHKPPYCSGSSVHAGFAGCYKKPGP